MNDKWGTLCEQVTGALSVTECAVLADEASATDAHVALERER